MRRVLAIIALLALVLVPAAAAQGKGKGKAKSKHGGFPPTEARIIMDYYGGGGSSGLPPGLAKRGGDLPPGIEKQLRRNGRLPPGLEKKVEPFPPELAHRLPPAPVGYRRVVYDRWAMLIHDATMVVADIIDLTRRR